MTATESNGSIVQASEGLRDITHKMKFRVVMMTPAVAQGLLDHNHPKNRNKKESRIVTYANDMSNGLWTLTHEAVAVDEDGWLIDGQNRLSAVILADKNVPMLLTTGVPRKAMLAVDQGASRNVADVAKVTGQSKPGMSNWSSVARSMIYGTKSSNSVGRASVQEVLAFIRAHEEAIAFAFEVVPIKRGISQAGVRAVVARSWYLGKSKHPRIREFGAVLDTGLQGSINRDVAAIKLRNWLLDTFTAGQRKRHGGMRPVPTIVYGKTQTALVAFLEERKIDNLRETAEENFPLPEEKTK